MNTTETLTARGLIAALSRLDPDTQVRTFEHDSDYMCSYEWSVAGVSDSGVIQKGDFVKCHEDYPEDEFGVEGSPS